MSGTECHAWSDVRASFKESQRQSIARSALELVMERGSAEVTMSTVAERAGISRQTLYRYFPDLGSVLSASVEGLPDADESLRAWVSESPEPREQLRRAVDALVDASSHGHGSSEELLAVLPPEAREGIHAHRQRTIDLFANILRAVKSAEGSAYDGPPDIDAVLLLGLVSAAAEQSRERTHELINRFIN
ncbi:TetR/AcrR family transcriptional regulator [Mycolicibacterium sp.]|uniref:TetR/AcrR family transcriptional regulator n=1 Tax=Mycolicibacterium sp. TaxID=2320850 RepID=UPI001D99AA9E|nr:TetR/AcrR family transcriptional regulator [Mycolicibacterium sp.]MCB1290289.1 TetR/AcrR family transcriptional regulator [Mycobacterium sp.]MCB9409198.1 TetR/AcrR family transcriptional regulator [Mycolicibacterium sp.]